MSTTVTSATVTKDAVMGYKRPSRGIFHFFPDSWVPYAELMRLDRPSGFWNFYWYDLIGLGYAVNIHPFSDDVNLMSLAYTAAYLALWTIVYRGITCTWNDNLDQDLDRQAARCRLRPMPRGAVTTSQAHVFTAVQIAVGACILSPYDRSVSIHAFLGGIMLFIYPLLKRFTNYPQVELGIGLSYSGIFMVAAMFGKDPVAPLWDTSCNFSTRLSNLAESPLARSTGSLYSALVFWCVIFDTIYAHQDYEDDLKAGIKGLAVRLGRKGTKPALSLAGVIQVYCLVLTGNYCGFGTLYYAISCAGAAVMLTAMLWTVKLDNRDSCAWWFGPGSSYVGALITSGLIADFLTKGHSS